MPNTEKTSRNNPLIPIVAKVTRVIKETPDVKTFHLTNKEGWRPFAALPGQLGMISVFGRGEAMFSLTDSKDYLEVSVKKVGTLTEQLHNITAGRTIGIRGPYGNGFPVDVCRGKNILFVAGGIGLAPVRSMVRWCLDKRADFGSLHLVYGARTSADLVYKDELFEVWPKAHDFTVSLTVDEGEPGWTGNIGLLPGFVRRIAPAAKNTVCIMCGPPEMIKFVLPELTELGFGAENIFTTLEMRMKCGIGKCGRCNIGSCYVCLDGPVFSLAQMRELPQEF